MKYRIVVLVAMIVADAAPAQQLERREVPECADQAEYSELDFWLGEWEVYSGDQKVGDNRIEKILGGCAISEYWIGIDGGQGQSLFYYDQAYEIWKQVWVTEWATIPGGVKEKFLVEKLPDGTMKFEGTIRIAGGASYLDRTTLMPRPNGEVRQHIEVSQDNGATWKTTFDAIYKRAQSTKLE